MKQDERHQARQRGLRLAAKITGISGLSVALIGLASAHAAAASTNEPVAKEMLPQVVRGGGCGCGPCWGPPAPPAEGFARRLG
jgi:hypothetical protein